MKKFIEEKGVENNIPLDKQNAQNQNELMSNNKSFNNKKFKKSHLKIEISKTNDSNINHINQFKSPNFNPVKNKDQENQENSYNNDIKENSGNLWRICLSKIYYKKTCWIFYVFLCFFTISGLIISIKYHNNRDKIKIGLVIELFCILIMTLDVLIKFFLSTCKEYFGTCWNVLEVILLVMSWISLIIYLFIIDYDKFELLTSFALISQSILQFFRIYFLIKHAQKIKNNIEEIIDFNSVFDNNTNRIKEKNDPKLNSINSYVHQNPRELVNSKKLSATNFINDESPNNKQVQNKKIGYTDSHSIEKIDFNED